jgi:hypothetical protein
LEVKEEPKKAEEEEQVRTWHDQAIVLRAKACQLQKGLCRTCIHSAKLLV